MNPKLTHAGALMLMAGGSVFAIADRITPLAAISPEVAHLWPFVMAAAVALVNFGHLLAPSLPVPQAPAITPIPATLPSSILSK